MAGSCAWRVASRSGGLRFCYGSTVRVSGPRCMAGPVENSRSKRVQTVRRRLPAGNSRSNMRYGS